MTKEVQEQIQYKNGLENEFKEEQNEEVEVEKYVEIK